MLNTKAEWTTPLFLYLLLITGCISTTLFPTEPEARLTTTLARDESLGSWPACSLNMREDHCWTGDVAFAFAPPLVTSVACNSVTYILNEAPSRTMTNIMTAVFSQLYTDIGFDPEYSSMWEQQDLQMLPALNDGDKSTAECYTWGTNSPADSNDYLACEIYAKDVHLLYSPPDPSLSRDMCAKTPSLTITDYGHAQHIPQTVLEGVTLYQDRVYISIEKIHAWTTLWSVRMNASGQPDLELNATSYDCTRQPLGTTIFNTIIELQSHEISTLRVPNTGRFYPFNYAVRLLKYETLNFLILTKF